MVQVGITNGGRSTKSSCIGCDPTSVVVTLLTNYGDGKRGKVVLGMADWDRPIDLLNFLSCFDAERRLKEIPASRSEPRGFDFLICSIHE